MPGCARCASEAVTLRDAARALVERSHARQIAVARAWAIARTRSIRERRSCSVTRASRGWQATASPSCSSLSRPRANLIKPLPINIDGALAAVLYDLGFPPIFGKFIFIIGRVAGLTAQVFEEYTREKPMRIRIPVDYDGEPPR